MAAQTPRTVIEVPRHLARSKALVTIYASYGGYDPEDGIPNISASTLALVGNVEAISVKANRGSHERRELRADVFNNREGGGQIIEQVPGLVDFEVQLTNIVTYKQTFLEAVGFGGFSTIYQGRPLLLALVLPSPNPDKYPEKWLILEGCWVKDNPVDFSVAEKDDLRIKQTIDLAVAKAYTL